MSLITLNQLIIDDREDIAFIFYIKLQFIKQLMDDKKNIVLISVIIILQFSLTLISEKAKYRYQWNCNSSHIHIAVIMR